VYSRPACLSVIESPPICSTGAIPLKAVISVTHLPNKKRGCRFDVVVGSAKTRTFSLLAKTREECELWVERITDAVAECAHTDQGNVNLDMTGKFWKSKTKIAHAARRSRTDSIVDMRLSLDLPNMKEDDMDLLGSSGDENNDGSGDYSTSISSSKTSNHSNSTSYSNNSTKHTRNRSRSGSTSPKHKHNRGRSRGFHQRTRSRTSSSHRKSSQPNINGNTNSTNSNKAHNGVLVVPSSADGAHQRTNGDGLHHNRSGSRIIPKVPTLPRHVQQKRHSLRLHTQRVPGMMYDV